MKKNHFYYKQNKSMLEFFNFFCIKLRCNWGKIKLEYKNLGLEEEEAELEVVEDLESDDELEIEVVEDSDEEVDVEIVEDTDEDVDLEIVEDESDIDYD